MARLLYALLFASCSACAADTMTVEEAYAAIPHHRTVFSQHSSKLAPAQVRSLSQLFAWSDQGTVLRVQALRDLRAGRLQDVRRTMDGYRTLIATLASSQPAAEIKPVQLLVLEAIQGHQRFFERKLQQSANPARIDASFTPEVHQASEKLRRAYGLLMNNFPNEPSINKAAFYDYLCALDFL